MLNDEIKKPKLNHVNLRNQQLWSWDRDDHTKDQHLLSWRREKRGRRRKIIVEAPSCNGGWHASAHHVEGGVMLRTPPWKATRGDWEALHMPPKGQWRLPPAGACTNFFYLSKDQNTLDPRDNCKKSRSKNQKCPSTSSKKKSWPQELPGN
jgi:hypothetical protein